MNALTAPEWPELGRKGAKRWAGHEAARPASGLAPERNHRSNPTARPLADFWRQPMPLNFREGMWRLAIVAGVSGSVGGATDGYLLAMPSPATRMFPPPYAKIMHVYTTALTSAGNKSLAK